MPRPEVLEGCTESVLVVELDWLLVAVVFGVGMGVGVDIAPALPDVCPGPRVWATPPRVLITV